MPRTLDDRDARLLNRLQADLPLVARPYAAVADELGTTEADVLTRVAALKGKPDGVIRQVGAIFDSKALGYRSCLVAAKVDPSHVDVAAAEVGRHPGVSHNYRREHAYNLWYTLAVPPTSALGLEGTVDLLHRRSGATVTRPMPALKLYKIGVRFDVGGETDAAPARVAGGGGAGADDAGAPSVSPITESDRRAIRVLQQDLPVVARPFDVWADEAGMTVDALLEAACRFRKAGWMRRFSAVLRHRAAGFGANAMGVWVVPPERWDAFGRTAASFAAVSHCYLRTTYPDWPYSLFTMVHGTSRNDCESVLAAVAAETGVREYSVLYSTVEYKKTRVRYFTGDVEAWEAAASLSTPVPGG